MFTLRSLSISSRRLGLGIAVAALAISTAAAPLSAFAQENLSEGNYEITPMAQKDNGPTPTQPNPNTPVTAMPKADLQVTANGKTQNGKTTTYHFKVKNNGPANAPQINGWKEAQTHAVVGDGSNVTDNGYFFFGLTSGQEKTFTISCTPQIGYYCDKGIMNVFMNNMQDPNFTNNIAVID
jgi:hypothetical protein